MKKSILVGLIILVICIPILALGIYFYNLSGEDDDGPTDLTYRNRMRYFVQNISAYARTKDANFIVIPQNGHELITTDGDPASPLATEYLAAISGVGREDLFYGYDSDNIATPGTARDRMIAFMDIAETNGVQVLTTDYCSTPTKMDDSYAQNAAKGYVSFAADHRELDNIPSHPAKPYNENALVVSSLAMAKNFLYILNPDAYASKTTFLTAIAQTNYDAVITDAFSGSTMLTPSEVNGLKTKANGCTRLAIAYMSIGEAEDYRYYWQASWKPGNPAWIAAENPEWEGNYKVKYWETAWQDIIFGSQGAYLDQILAAGFDGVYLDIIDAYEYFE